MSSEELRALEKRVARIERRLRGVARDAADEVVRAIESSQEKAAAAQAVRERRHLRIVR